MSFAYILKRINKKQILKVMTENEKNLFLPHVSSRHPSVVRENASILQRKFAMINEILPVLENPNGKEELKYFSNIYVEAKTVLTQIVRFVTENKIADKKGIEENVRKAEEILGYLKILHLRYKSVYTFPPISDKPAWYKYSQMENREIIEVLKKLITI